MQIKFSSDFSKIMEYSRDEALRTGCNGIGVDHLMLGIIRHRHNDAVYILNGLGVDTEEFKKAIDARVFRKEALPFTAMDSIRASRGAHSVLSMAAFEALKSGFTEVGASHILAAISLSGGTASADFLASKGIDRQAIVARSSRDGENRNPALDVKFEDISGALSEQLRRLFGGDSAGILS